MQGVLFIRLVAAGVVVGFSRPSFEPTCVARTSLLPASISVLAVDLILIGFLIIRAASLGMFSDLRGKESSLKKEQSKAFILTTTGFVLWTAVSQDLIWSLWVIARSCMSNEKMIKQGGVLFYILVVRTRAEPYQRLFRKACVQW